MIQENENVNHQEVDLFGSVFIFPGPHVPQSFGKTCIYSATQNQSESENENAVNLSVIFCMCNPK